MPHFKYLHRSSFIKDALWLIALNVILLFVFAYFDVFEKVVLFVEQYEHLELDELLPLSASLTISLLFFAYRRMVELGQVGQAFENLAKLDPLTHTLNRRAGHALLTTTYQKAQKNKAQNTESGFSLLQVDLDNFKRINDLYGASIGDEILVNMARVVQKNLPQGAELIHWHSDNFLIILPSQIAHPSIQPVEFANNLCVTVEQELFKADPITCSIGLTTWQSDISLEQMLHALEDALLDAKEKNKNTVKVA